jgi:tRNA threonylcarbamoyladenosine dehydratase
MDDLLTRTTMLLGEENVKKYLDKTVLVAGLGGVGGTALECLARSGITHFILIDHDVVNLTNLNRQILFLNEDIGLRKTEVASCRLKAINPSIITKTIFERISPDTLSMLDQLRFDAVIDAVDSVPAKATLVEVAHLHGVPIICSLGMAKRVDPQKVITTDLSQTHHDPLAKALRHLLREKYIDPQSVPVVFSLEEPIGHHATPSSMMMVPSTAGIQLASYVIQAFIHEFDV